MNSRSLRMLPYRSLHQNLRSYEDRQIGVMAHCAPISKVYGARGSDTSGYIRQMRVNLSLGCRDACDCLNLQIFLEAKAAPLATVARLLVTPVGRTAIVGDTVEVDVSRSQLLRDLSRALDAPRPYIASQPIGRILGHHDGVSLVAIADDRERGTGRIPRGQWSCRWSCPRTRSGARNIALVQAVRAPEVAGDQGGTLVANAIRNATGLRLAELPMSPPKVLAAITATN